MKQAILRRTGPPSAFEIEEVEEPAVGASQVRIEVARCGVSSRDVAERSGLYRRDVTLPLVIGLEIAGTVVELGFNLEGGPFHIGDRVATKAFSSCGYCRLCRSGRETSCALRKPVRGGYAQSTVVDGDAVVRLPTGLEWDQACSLGAAAGVALNAVRDVCQVAVGETVLVSGASGGVGSAALQLAALSGARVVALTRSEAKRDALIEDGASDVVVLSSRSAAVSRIREITDGQGVDVVIDTVGSSVFDACFDALAVHGRYGLVGELNGANIAINPARIFFRRAALLGVGSVSRNQLADVAAMAALGQLRTRVGAVLALEDVGRAHALVESAELHGRLLLAPNGL